MYATHKPVEIQLLSVGFELVSHRKIKHGLVTGIKVHFPRKKADQCVGKYFKTLICHLNERYHHYFRKWGGGGLSP